MDIIFESHLNSYDVFFSKKHYDNTLRQMCSVVLCKDVKFHIVKFKKVLLELNDKFHPYKIQNVKNDSDLRLFETFNLKGCRCDFLNHKNTKTKYHNQLFGTKYKTFDMSILCDTCIFRIEREQYNDEFYEELINEFNEVY